MQFARPALGHWVHQSFAREREQLGERGINEILDAGRGWDLAATLTAGGALVFPHAGVRACGHQIAAAVHACLDSGTERVLVIGVLHALTENLEAARIRVANGADVTQEASWGIQGPGLDRSDQWRREFSLSNFLYLWEKETRRRGIQGPELILRYPYLAGGRPMILPGIDKLQKLMQDAVVVSTADPFHHGIGYGDPSETALFPQAGGLDLAREQITAGIEILEMGDYWGYNQHCVTAKSDARDAGQVMRYLLGPVTGRILDLAYEDTTEMYDQPAPTWVATALIEWRPV